MLKSKSKKIPHFNSYSKLVDFFDQNDLGEYFDSMPEVRFNVKLRRNLHLFALDSELAKRITRLARLRKTSSEKLINTWVKEKVQRLSG